MRPALLLVLPILLCGCDRPARLASGCSEDELQARIEKFSQGAARMATLDMASLNESMAGRYEAFAVKIQAASERLARNPASLRRGEAYLQETCKAYDELLTELNKMLDGQPGSVSAEPVETEESNG
jgi:hypothetical protein